MNNKTYKIKVNVAAFITICVFTYLIVKSDTWQTAVLRLVTLALMSAVSLHLLVTIESYDAYKEVVYDEKSLDKLSLSEHEVYKYIVSELTIEKSFIHILLELWAELVYALISKSCIMGKNLYDTTHLSMYYIDEYFLIKSLKRIIPVAENVYKCTYDDYVLIEIIRNNVDIVMLDSVKWDKIFNKYKSDIHLSINVTLNTDN